MQFDRRMSFAEGMMWRLERDPQLSSTFGNITVFDRPIDIDRLRRRLERAAHLVPRLHQRVQEIPGNVAPPVWVADHDFHIERHVRTVQLSGEAGDRELYDLAVSLIAQPFDTRHPLWEFVVVEGLSGGRGALIQKLHHTVADGETSVQLSLQFLDLERDAPPPPPLPEDERAELSRGPSAEQLAREAFEQVGKAVNKATRQMLEMVSQPQKLAMTGVAAFDAAKAIGTTLTDTSAARSPLWTGRSARRHLETLRVPFRAAKDAATTMGGTLNHLFLTAAADAAGAYHRVLGSPVDTLRASMAVSTRTSESGANAFSLVRFEVPTAEMAFAERFAAVRDLVAAARQASSGANLDTLARIGSTLPTPVLTRLARQQAHTIDFATSNVKAAPFPCYIAGGLILANYPIGPLSGVAFNLTLLSYNGSLDMGLNVDPAAVADPELLRVEMERSFAAAVKPPKPKRSGSRRAR